MGDKLENSTARTKRVLQYRECDMFTARITWPTPWNLKFENGCEPKPMLNQELHCLYSAVRRVALTSSRSLGGLAYSVYLKLRAHTGQSEWKLVIPLQSCPKHFLPNHWHQWCPRPRPLVVRLFHGKKSGFAIRHLFPASTTQSRQCESRLRRPSFWC